MLNQHCLQGRLTYEPELKTTKSGVSVISFQVACERDYVSQGAERQADFIDCVAWKGTAEFIHRYFHKGDMILINGRIETRNYTDNGDKQRKAVEVVANNVSFCGGNKNGTQSDTQPNLNVANDDFEEIVDDSDDLPF